MENFVKEIIGDLNREKLIKILLAIVPDLPDNIKNNLDKISGEALSSSVISSIVQKASSGNGPGSIVTYVKKDPLLFCFSMIENKKMKLDKIFADDFETKKRCLKIGEFLKSLNTLQLSALEKEKLDKLREEAKQRIEKKHPLVYKHFSGFQLSEDMDDVFVIIKKEVSFESSSVEEFGNVLIEKNPQLAEIILRDLKSAVEKNF